MARRILTLCTLLLLAACATNSDPMDPGPPAVQRLDLASTTATAGATYAIPSLSTLHLGARSDVRVEVDGVEAALLLRGDGSQLVAVPLYLDTTTLWPAPPTDPVAVEVYEGDRLLAQSDPVLTITAPTETPGTTAQFVADLNAWLDGVEAAFDQLALEPGPGQAYVGAIVPALREVLDQNEELSLQAQLDALGDEQRKVLDVLIQGLEMDAWSQQMVAGLDAARTQMGGGAAKKDLPACPGTSIGDTQLAAFMQYAAFARQYAGDFVANFSSTLSTVNTGIGLSLLAYVGQEIPILGDAMSAITAVVGVVDLFLNKIAVALMPTRIESLNLDVPQTSLTLGEQTQSTFSICAVNEPPGVTINDLVGQVINVAGALFPGGPSDARLLIEQVVLTVLEQVNNLISAYASQNPQFELNTQVFEVPLVRWTADIHDPGLVTQLSGAPDVFEVLATDLEWKAVSGGTSSVRFLPSTSPSALVIPGYSGAAFGDDVVSSNVVALQVNDLVLEVNMASVFTPGGVNALSAKAGHDGPGGVQWEEGIFIDLSIEGGTGDPLGAHTDADGDFLSLITPDEQATEVSVRVRATDTAGNQVEETVTALVEGVELTLETRSSSLQARSALTSAACDLDNRDSTLEPGAWSGTVTAQCGENATSATQQSTVLSRAEDPTLSALLRVTATGQAEASGGSASDWAASSVFTTVFRVTGGAARLKGTYTLEFESLFNTTASIFLDEYPGGQILLDNDLISATDVDLDILLPETDKSYRLSIRVAVSDKDTILPQFGFFPHFALDYEVVPAAPEP